MGTPEKATFAFSCVRARVLSESRSGRRARQLLRVAIRFGDRPEILTELRTGVRAEQTEYSIEFGHDQLWSPRLAVWRKDPSCECQVCDLLVSLLPSRQEHRRQVTPSVFPCRGVGNVISGSHVIIANRTGREQEIDKRSAVNREGLQHSVVKVAALGESTDQQQAGRLQHLHLIPEVLKHSH